MTLSLYFLSTTKAIEWWGPTATLATSKIKGTLYVYKTTEFLGPNPNFPSTGEPTA